METHHKKSESINQISPETASGKGGADAENTHESGAGIVDKTAHAVEDAYDKTAHAVENIYDKTAKPVSKTYEKARNYSNENPGKAIFIALGVGVGLGLLLGANSHQSRSSRMAEPVVNAVADVALAFFR